MTTIYLVQQARSRLVDFGVAELSDCLAAIGITVRGPHETLRGEPSQTPAVVVRLISDRSAVAAFEAGAEGRDEEQYPDESFTVERSGEVITVSAPQARGLMYGCLELADLVRTGRWTEDDLSISKSPTLRVRGIKFNLPYEPYSNGDPFRQNVQTALDLEFWRAFIDELARSRYNCLSLWSLHPFPLMISSPAFRAANPHSDREIAEHEAFFHALFDHAQARGIDIYLFTWNVYLPAPVARGLGLPAALANSSEGTPETNRWDAARARQLAPVVAEYFEEMIFRLLITYPQIAGIGTSGSEAMTGTGAEKEQWLADTYLRAIERSGRRVKFIHRTNMQAVADIDRITRPRVPPSRFYFSWKYSIAHCYSHPRPAFEDSQRPWDGLDHDDAQILYTVRNDDVHTHRWADTEYVREYVRGMSEKPRVHGFYWGADGYLWGRDFQHVDHGHKDWRWDFERHRQQFQLWGRLSYDVDTRPELFARLAVAEYGDDAAQIHAGLQSASMIIPAVNRLCWRDLDFQWHPEGCLTRDGFRTVIDFVDSRPMPGAGTVGIGEFVRAKHAGEAFSGRETPPDVIARLKRAADLAEACVAEVEQRETPWRLPQATCALLDLRATAALGRYYAAKIGAALELAEATITGRADAVDRAIDLLQDAVRHWTDLGHHWSQHYQPYRMARVARVFGYPYYLEDVRRDIELAREFTPRAEPQ